MAAKKSGITKRWILNTLCVIVVVLLGFLLVALLLFKEQYYESVRMTLNSRATGMVQSYFDLSTVNSDEAFNLPQTFLSTNSNTARSSPKPCPTFLHKEGNSCL